MSTILPAKPVTPVPGLPEAPVIEFPHSLSEHDAETASGDESPPQTMTCFCRPRYVRPVIRLGLSAVNRPVR
jgi:hypothetical protein